MQTAEGIASGLTKILQPQFVGAGKLGPGHTTVERFIIDDATSVAVSIYLVQEQSGHDKLSHRRKRYGIMP